MSQESIAPQVTAKYGTPEWEQQVTAYEKWLDDCFARVTDCDCGCGGNCTEDDRELDYYEQHRRL